MFKVISAEIKKMLSKPGIYILSILLAIILVLGVFIYEPMVYKNNSVTLTGNTYIDRYTYFIGDDDTNKTKGIKVETDKNIENAINLIESYSVATDAGNVTLKVYIDSVISNINTKVNAYQDLANSTENVESLISDIRNTIPSELEKLNSAIISANTKASNGAYSLLITKNQYNEYVELYKDITAWAQQDVSYGENRRGYANHCNEYVNGYKVKLSNLINSFIYPELPSDFVETFTIDSVGSKLNTLNNRLSLIVNEINSNYDLAVGDVSGKNLQLTQNMTDLANKYVNTANTFIDLIKYELICHAFENVSTTEKMNIMHLSNFSSFNASSLNVRLNYLFENNLSENDFSKPLTIGIASNNEINAYDYAYFVLRLFSFVIIAYAIMTACHSIAGEIKEGSMRYFAIRPISRTSILFGKLLSIIIISTILTIFSSIIAVCVGGAVYGFNTLNVLTIFNGNIAITMHPIIMILIYVVSMLLELTIYTSIALLLSCVIKSDLLSVTIVLALYLVNTLLPVFINGVNSWLTFYPMSHINLYALFGSSVYSTTQNFYNVLLGAKVYAGTNLILTIIMISLIITITSISAAKLFKKKEL